jgi:hypothetical protein
MLQEHNRLPSASRALSNVAVRLVHNYIRQAHILCNIARNICACHCAPLCVSHTCFFSALKRTPLAMCSPHVLHQMLKGTSKLQPATVMHVSLLAHPLCHDCPMWNISCTLRIVQSMANICWGASNTKGACCHTMQRTQGPIAWLHIIPPQQGF